MSCLNLNKDRYLDSELAVILGDSNAAIIFNRIKYLIDRGMGFFYKNQRWFWNSIKDWRDKNFQWMSFSQVRRSLEKLRNIGLLKAEFLHSARVGHNCDRWNRTLYYTIDTNRLKELLDSKSTKEVQSQSFDDLSLMTNQFVIGDKPLNNIHTIKNNIYNQSKSKKEKVQTETKEKLNHLNQNLNSQTDEICKQHFQGVTKLNLALSTPFGFDAKSIFSDNAICSALKHKMNQDNYTSKKKVTKTNSIKTNGNQDEFAGRRINFGKYCSRSSDPWMRSQFEVDPVFFAWYVSKAKAKGRIIDIPKFKQEIRDDYPLAKDYWEDYRASLGNPTEEYRRLNIGPFIPVSSSKIEENKNNRIDFTELKDTGQKIHLSSKEGGELNFSESQLRIKRVKLIQERKKQQELEYEKYILESKAEKQR